MRLLLSDRYLTKYYLLYSSSVVAYFGALPK